MSMPKRKFREIALQALFSLNISPEQELDLLVEQLMHEVKSTKKSIFDAVRFAQMVIVCQKDIDPLISAASTEYRIERIGEVECAIIRLLAYEVGFSPEKIDLPIAISEAVRLSRKFSTRESSSFVHAVLDKVLKQLQTQNESNKNDAKQCATV